MTNLEFPSINAATLPGQMEQVRRYLYQFAERLSWALATLESEERRGGIRVTKTNASGGTEEENVSTFEDLKSLIISSADIVQSFASAAKRIYDGRGDYVAQSDFGTYKEERKTLLDVDEETGVTLLMTEVQRIEVDETGEEHSYRGCIRLGKVTMPGEDGEVYGVSVGQVEEHNGTKTYTTSARYKSNGIDFYDEMNRRVAGIETNAVGESRFFIEDAEIYGSLILGEYITDLEDGVAFVWKE